MKKAVQQIMLGTVTKNEKQTAETLRRIKAAGYDGIEHTCKVPERIP